MIHPKYLVPGAILMRTRYGETYVRRVTERGEFATFGGQADTDSCRYVTVEHTQKGRIGNEGQTTRRSLSAWADTVR